MPDYLMHDPSLFHGEPPFDAAKVQAEQQAAQGLSPAVSASAEDSPSEGADAQHEPAEEASATTYEDMTVDDLRQIARERGISYAGLNKADLISALDEDDETAA